MKKLTEILMALGMFLGLIASLFLTSCGNAKKLSKASDTPVVVGREKTTSLEGEKVVEETMQLQGIEMAGALSEDGKSMEKVAYKWFAGMGKADNKQMAVELAQREAYATISRVLNNAVQDKAERGNVANNGKVQQALKSHWKQVSISLTKACEPFGETKVQYNSSTRMYDVIARVGVRGDRFMEILNRAGAFRPAELSGADLEEFIQTNQAIMDAAKAN